MSTQKTLETVVDDLLLTVDHVAAGNSADVESRVSDRISDLFMPRLTQWVVRHRRQQQGAQAGAELVASAVAQYVSAQSFLSAGLLAWAAEQTGMSVAEVLMGAREKGGW